MNHSIMANRHAAGLFAMSVRLVVGWTYFSAFWRRLVLDNKLIPEEAGYIGEKFNHFLPNALGIKPLIEYLVTHPDVLQGAMIAFTIVEAIVGLFLLLGLFTRLMSIGVTVLAAGILLGSGWLGTTCLDEWQIGVLGIAGGFTIFLSGGGPYSLDYYLRKRTPFGTRKWVQWSSSAQLSLKNMKTFVLTGSLLILLLTLYTNQYFHGGVWGPLHNKSVRPKLEISEIVKNKETLTFTVFRTEGADVYGSFLVGIQLLDKHKNLLKVIGGEELALFPEKQIHNYYVAKVKPGKYSLILPLGAKANLTLGITDIADRNDAIKFIRLLDISGIEWTVPVP